MALRQARSGWSVRIGTALGIPIRVHFTFLLLLIWFGFSSARLGDQLVLALAFLLSVFGCVLLHELGHAAMARRFGVRTRDIVLYPIGGVARLENIPGGRAELWIALAGPAVNVVLALLLAALLLATPLAFGRWGERLLDADVLVSRLLVANVMLAVFNLIPAFPMDGGRVLRAGLALGLGQERATEIAAAVGQGMAILFGAAGLLFQHPLLLLIALFVFVGASQEAFASRQRAVVLGKTAREAMITRFDVLAPQDSLDRAARCLLETHQQDFPVVDAWNRVVGVLPRARLLEGLARAGGAAPVLDVMERDFARVTPDSNLEAVLDLLRARGLCPVIVMDEGRLIGMITLDNLSEYIAVTRQVSTEGAR